MDFIGAVPKTPREKDAILMVVDRLNKMAHFIPTVEIVHAPQIVDF